MAPIVVCSHVSKEYRTPKRQTGLLGGLRTLFTRQYEVKRAVDDVSFSLEEGELLGYIGPNGAGKSTTIKMLTGILTPTSGTLEVAGLTPWRIGTIMILPGSSVESVVGCVGLAQRRGIVSSSAATPCRAGNVRTMPARTSMGKLNKEAPRRQVVG